MKKYPIRRARYSDQYLHSEWGPKGSTEMNTIRLKPVGKTKHIMFRIVVANSQSPIKGKDLEILGHYDPHTHPATIVLNDQRARYWLAQGAQPSDTVGDILKRRGVVDEGGKLVVVPGTAADPLVRVFTNFLKRRYPRLARQPDRLNKFAVQLANYSRAWAEHTPHEAELFEAVDKQMREWMRQFVAEEDQLRTSRKEETVAASLFGSSSQAD